MTDPKLKLHSPVNPARKQGVEQEVTPVNPQDIPALVGQAVAELLMLMARIADSMEDVADCQDELVMLAEKRAIKDGLVTQDELDERTNADDEEPAA